VLLTSFLIELAMIAQQELLIVMNVFLMKMFSTKLSVLVVSQGIH